mmetsp:Transcript_23671/g.29331  ORF Transcript_23671/g.29331 Transcript_23671/m.29331 type:complete len:186 (+) Transcript_23671:1186-1743(+)
MLYLNVLHLIVFFLLKSLSLSGPSAGEEDQNRKDVQGIEEHRRHSCCDGKTIFKCCSSRVRNMIMFGSIGVGFFVLPILLLLQAFATQFSPGKLEELQNGMSGTVSAGEQTNGSRMLSEAEDEGDVDPLAVVRYWIFISLIASILFSLGMLTPLMQTLYKQAKDPSKVKIKSKPLGGYSPEDPKR